MKEKTMWTKIIANSQGGFFQKIADAFTEGVPDVFYAIDGKAGWIELKEVKNKIEGNIRITPAQAHWLNSLACEGVDGWILCNWEHKEGKFVFLIEWSKISHCDFKNDRFALSYLESVAIMKFKAKTGRGFLQEEWVAMAVTMHLILTGEY